MDIGKEVLIITGACGVGKTTTAKEWAKSKNGAIIESDYLTEWVFKKIFLNGMKKKKNLPQTCLH